MFVKSQVLYFRMWQEDLHPIISLLDAQLPLCHQLSIKARSWLGLYLSFVSLFSFGMYQQRNFLVTVGEDEQISPQQSAMCLKVFDLDKMQPEGTSSSIPDCIGILRIFTNQFPQAKVFLSCSIYFDFFASVVNCSVLFLSPFQFPIISLLLCLIVTISRIQTKLA